MVLALTSILASLLLFEIGLRAYAGLIYPKMMIFDPLLGWRHSPNVRRAFVNEFGEIGLASGSRRIDSYMFFGMS